MEGDEEWLGWDTSVWVFDKKIKADVLEDGVAKNENGEVIALIEKRTVDDTIFYNTKINSYQPKMYIYEERIAIDEEVLYSPEVSNKSLLLN